MKLFVDRITSSAIEKQSPCVVGLDPNIALMPKSFILEHGELSTLSRPQKAELLLEYNKMVIDHVYDLVPAVKPQSAYYETYGSDGIRALEQTVTYAKSKGLVVILDAKRGDIGATSEAYAKAYLDEKNPIEQNYDCMTLAPYLGEDSLEPFVRFCIDYGKGIFVCVKTSNKGSGTFQDKTFTDDTKLYEAVADLVRKWGEQQIGQYGISGIGAVVGATYPEEAQILRKRMPHTLFLVPGYGAQGGDAKSAKACFLEGIVGAVISSSRGISFPKMPADVKTSQIGSFIREAAVGFVKEVRQALL